LHYAVWFTVLPTAVVLPVTAQGTAR